MDASAIFELLNEYRHNSYRLGEHTPDQYADKLKTMRHKFEQCLFENLSNDDFSFEYVVERFRRDERIMKSTFGRLSSQHCRPDEVPFLNILKEEYEKTTDIINHLVERHSKKANASEEATGNTGNVDDAPYFKSLSINEQKAGVLYDKLVNGGYLEDTSKTDFTYYFTGKGPKPQSRLVWKADAFFLSVLMERVSSTSISWETLDNIFTGLNVSSMKSYLSKVRKQKREGYSQPKYDTYSQMIDLWLK